MKHNPSTNSLSQTRRRWARPVATISAGGAALAIWLEELILFAAEIVALIFLPILGGLIFLFNRLVFREAIPQQNDLQKAQDMSGVKSDGLQ